ncbi:MAG: phage integrase N-terminal SAM-like domain-containing protein, partial [Halanaerobiales bacterium]
MSKITMENKCSLTLGEAWEKFKRHCKVKNLAEVTIDYYKHGYEYLLEYFGKDYKVKDIEQEYIEELIEDLMVNSELKKTSINSKLRAIRRFLYFYMDRNYLTNYKISLLKVQNKQKRPYTDGELEKLLEKPGMDECIFSEYRNWVIVNFLLG